MAQQQRLVYSLPPSGKPGFTHWVEQACAGSTLTADQQSLLKAAAADGAITHPALEAISVFLSSTRRTTGTDSEAPTLSAFLRSMGATPQIAVVENYIPASATTFSTAARRGRQKTLGQMTPAEREEWREEMRSRAAHRDYYDLVSDVRKREVTQGKAESFALYQQQFSVGVGVLISLITACVVGYYVGRHFIDVNNKAGPYITAAAFGVTLLLVEVLLIIIRLSRADAAAHEAHVPVAEVGTLRKNAGPAAAAAAAAAASSSVSGLSTGSLAVMDAAAPAADRKRQ